MEKTGLIALNGIPGSGKTLDATYIALQHYKSQNSFIRYYTSFIKYKLYNFIHDLPFYNKFKEKFDYFINFEFLGLHIFKILFKIIYYFFNLFIFLFLFVECSIYFKILIVLYFLYFKKIIRGFNKLDYEYYCIFPYKKINNVYSTYPILLDKKRNIWSNNVSLYDLDNSVSFYPDSLIIIDEIQLFVDSDEYKEKNKKVKISKIAKFLQAHRHFGIKQIIFTSQSPTRIFKKGRNIVVGYLKQNKIIDLPFNISIMRGTMYYDFDYYGKYIPRYREERKKLPFDYKKVFKIFLRNKVYSAYDSRYLSKYNYKQPLLDKGTWNDYKVSSEHLTSLFEDTIE